MVSRMPEPGVSYQLYSSRNFGPLAETVRMLAGFGYDQAEGYAAVFDQAVDLRRALDGVGMAMPTGHFPLWMLEGELDRVIEIAGVLGIQAVFCPSLGAAEYPADAGGWQSIGWRLDRIGVRLAAAGLRFGWHNHDFEFQPLVDGSLPLDHIFAGAPKLLWQFDVAWSVVGGQDPFKLIARHGHRILSAHVKDIAPVGTNTDQDGWTDVGRGTLDWPVLIRALRRAGCEHFVIEHDNPADDESFAATSIASVREILS